MRVDGEGRDRHLPPLLLLDVDGVLNAVTDDVPAGYRRAVTHGLTITWRPALVEPLDALHAAGTVELAWLTSWNDRADRHLAPLVGLPGGLRVLPVADRPPGSHPMTAKLPAAQRALDGTARRFGWLDDELGSDGAAWDWLASLRPGRSFALAVEAGRGLTDADLARVERFAAAEQGHPPGTAT